jgi:hypothetical protein
MKERITRESEKTVDSEARPKNRGKPNCDELAQDREKRRVY